MPWIVSILAGLLLAFLLYWLVRLRMYVAPKMHDRYGTAARVAIWVLVGALMIAVANLELIGLHSVLIEIFGQNAILAHEILFALVALAVGYYLVARHVINKPRDKNSGKGC
jgi:hypothetical protein